MNAIIIDDKYIKEKTLGRGGEGFAYFVLEKDTNKEYVAKILEPEEMKEKKEYEKDEDFEQNLEEKKRMFNKIKQINSPYLIGCIREGIGKIKQNDEILKERNILFLILLKEVIYGK